MSLKQKIGWVAMAGISIAMVIGIVITPGYHSSINAFLLNNGNFVHPSNYADSAAIADPDSRSGQSRPKDADVDADLYNSS